MSTLFVEVKRIEELLPHTNADALEIVHLSNSGWQVVVQKGQYVVGQKVLHFLPDTVLSVALSDKYNTTKYLGSGGRVKTVKLRGEVSFGFIVPAEDTDVIGENVVERFGKDVSKYEPPVTQVEDAERDDPRFPKYTGIEHLRQFPDILKGEMVYVTEKLHGCVPSKTKILLSDNSSKKITDIEIGDEVLGVSEDGLIVLTKVLNKFNNGKADGWLTISGRRFGAGRGNSFFSVSCTKNHKFYVQGDYVEASNLKIGDKLSTIRFEQKLTPIQEQVLLGKMLGDGSLEITQHTASIKFTHKKDHKEYVDWTLSALGDLGSKTLYETISGYGTNMLRATTIRSGYIKTKFESFIKSAIKHIPDWVASELNPLALAFWYMDDGSLGHREDQEDRANFATCAFDETDIDTLLKALLRLGITGTKYQANNYWRIRLNADEAEKMFLLIVPYIPSVMQYKLPERYRGHTAWIPKLEQQYKPNMVDVIIDSISENTAIDSNKWDIETETHNFFANRLLVHNSNVRIAFIDGEMYAGSHNNRRKKPENIEQSRYWLPWTIPAVADFLKSNPGAVLYGEIYGRDVQKGFTYDAVLRPHFRAFDLLLDGKYVSYDDFQFKMQEYQIPVVPVLATGLFNLESIKALAQGNSTIGPQHIREGVVVGPIHEMFDPKIGRVKLKYISDAYMVKADEKREKGEPEIAH